MHERTLEATIWCPRCPADKFELWSEHVGGGHNHHVVVPEGIPLDARKFCVCGAVLERKL